MTPKYTCRRQGQRWIITHPNGAPLFNGQDNHDALAIIRAIHGRATKPRKEN